MDPPDGHWSAGANWRDQANNPGVPGSADTVIFKNTNNNNSRMDLALPVNAPTVSVLRVDGYTGAIKIQTKLSIDVLTMSSGAIATDSTTFGGNPNLLVGQDNNSRTCAASTWTGGTIGDTVGGSMELWVNGIPTHPMTFNVGHATTAPTFAGSQWYIGADATVNWN